MWTSLGLDVKDLLSGENQVRAAGVTLLDQTQPEFEGECAWFFHHRAQVDFRRLCQEDSVDFEWAVGNQGSVIDNELDTQPRLHLHRLVLVQRVALHY